MPVRKARRRRWPGSEHGYTVKRCLVSVREARRRRWPGSEALRFATSPDQRSRRASLGQLVMCALSRFEPSANTPT